MEVSRSRSMQLRLSRRLYLRDQQKNSFFLVLELLLRDALTRVALATKLNFLLRKPIIFRRILKKTEDFTM